MGKNLQILAFGYRQTSDAGDGGGATWDDKSLVELFENVLRITKFDSKLPWDNESYELYFDKGKIVHEDGTICRVTNQLDIPYDDLGEVKVEIIEGENNCNKIQIKYRKKNIWSYLMNLFPENITFSADQSDSFLHIEQAINEITKQRAQKQNWNGNIKPDISNTTNRDYHGNTASNPEESSNNHGKNRPSGDIGIIEHNNKNNNKKKVIINFCNNCGLKVIPGSKFCSKCGNRLL
ncbi:zinc ribbon domain-containing protein [Methanococcoides burtonii]|uniref:Zinc-ribbon domain-containing protein n=1 Tax=Methanococcoides burtonii (strain DSM 6242 / NBRC 107633 / OCM 468 / ACE-M) TaxID=259564 RepID=Q12Z06_METBU|nr:zinc ribbon domain-containing protein [Methanococcoides burtonii]ABE51320.1 Hypothetical protein Mbur_0320 [Methanococcoides burtonii DSM 6242]